MLLLVALFAGSLAQTPAPTPAGDVAAGKAIWNEPQRWCKRCHGENAEGGFGPDLAGRGLSVEQVKRAIRQPWVIMPAYTPQQVNDKMIADLTAYFASMPKVAEPGAPRFVTPPGGSLGMRYAIDFYGCSQCHEPEFSNPRRILGGVAGIADLEYFKKQVYEHTDFSPRGVMGNFRRDRVPETAIEEIRKYVMGLGLRALLAAVVAPPAAGDTTYTLTVRNDGKKQDGGLTAEDLTVSLVLPAGATVTKTTGPNYVGVKHDAATNADIAQWTLPRLVAEEVQTFSITLGGATAASGIQRGSVIRWMKPNGGRDAPNYPQLPGGEYRDARIQDQAGDFINVNLPRAAR
jgi:mono/diheme cytochrome c family protein